MLKNTELNRMATLKIAKTLSGLNKDVVYVGGAIVSLYIDDPAADDVRPTKDIDISLKIHSLNELENIREELVRRGFKQYNEDKVICRFRYEDILVDVMSTKKVGWAPANRWFAPGFERKFLIDIGGQKIYLMPLPYFMASKFDAFHGRGSKDPRTSHDYEDIVYLLSHTSNVSHLIQKADEPVKDYLNEQFNNILKDSGLQEAILGNLFFDGRDEHYKLIIDRIEATVKGV